MMLVKRGYAGFFDADYPSAWESAGFTRDELEEYPQEDYDFFWSNPDGYYQDWSSGWPVMVKYK